MAGAGGAFLAGAGAFFLAGAGAFFLPFALGAPLTGRRVTMNCFEAFPPFCVSVHVVVLIFMLYTGGILYRMTLPRGTKFTVPRTGKHKYTASVPGYGTVRFGHRDYEHYKDSVPRSLGGGQWSHRDHRDTRRRALYRARHGAQRCADGTPCVEKRFSPAWFSYRYLW